MAGTFYVLFLIDGHPRLAPMVAGTVRECEKKAYERMKDEIDLWTIKFMNENGYSPDIKDFKPSNWRVGLYASESEAQRAENVYHVCFNAKDAIKALYKKMGVRVCSACGVNPVDEFDDRCNACIIAGEESCDGYRQ